MAATKVWTLEDLDALPDDNNTYELVHGELFVTPAPTNDHETIAVRLARALEPYVASNDLGYIYRPRAVIQHDGSQVEPDLMVRRPGETSLPWDKAPMPVLVAEILSPSNKRRHRQAKRAFYGEAGVPEYWIVDPITYTITSVRPGEADVVAATRLSWYPIGATEPLVVNVPGVFGV
jgi:Uma2 family endonuclease